MCVMRIHNNIKTHKRKHIILKKRSTKNRHQTLKGGKVWDTLKRKFFLKAKQEVPLTEPTTPMENDNYKTYMADVKIKINIDPESIALVVDELQDNTPHSQEIDNKNIINRSFKDSNFFAELESNIKKLIYSNGTNEWEDCLEQCYEGLHSAVINEITSTAYMLRTITKCFVVPKIDEEEGKPETQKKKEKHIEFIFTGSNINNITGLWEKDYKLFDIKIFNPDEGTIDLDNLSAANKPKTGRLIMGFGPSASGKTHCASLVIELMGLIEPTEFPDFFLTVDGGIFREQSVVYQTIVRVADQVGIAGLSNLVSASFFAKGKTIFTSDIIKSAFRKYLAHQRDNGFIINLYVPETLSKCKKGISSCQNKFEKYIDITGDTNWIGLMIYQHRTSCECPYTKDYKCTGTTESGKEREKQEGKKYSSGAWEWSYDNGNTAINYAPKYRFRIHNVGKHGGTHSIFEDLHENKINMDSEKLRKFFSGKKLVYFPDKVKNTDNCHEYSTECKHKTLPPRRLTTVVGTVVNVARAVRGFKPVQKKPEPNVNTVPSHREEVEEGEPESFEKKSISNNTEYESNV